MASVSISAKSGSNITRGLRALFTFLACAAFAATARAQTYPDRPVHILVGFAAGSGPDVEARTVASQVGADLGQNFIVENRPGANGTIATNVVAQSAPDGYTLLFTSDSIASTPYIYKELPYDVLKDLTPIASAGVLDGLLVLVNPSSPAHSIDDFIAYAKSHRVLYGSPGIGNGLHLAAALFNKTVGLNMEHVPFKGASEVVAALLGGSIDVMFVTPPSVLGPDQRRQAAGAGLHRIKAVSGIARCAADEDFRSELSAGRFLGHILCAGEDAARDRRRAQCRLSQGLAHAGSRQRGAKIRLHAG